MLLLLVDVDGEGLNKLLILLIDTADVLCSMASAGGDVLFGISFRIFSKYLITQKRRKKINIRMAWLAGNWRDCYDEHMKCAVYTFLAWRLFLSCQCLD